LYVIKPQTFWYNYNNILIVKHYLEGSVSEKYADKIPRKLIVYKNYFNLYASDPILFLIGSGPGTFNSRTSFLLNGEYSKIKWVEKITAGSSRPHYASLGAYPLWNPKNMTSNLTNGTRNQPFSSIVSILAEYGFVFFLLLGVFLYNKIKGVGDKAALVLKKKQMSVQIDHVKYLKLSSVFLFIGLFTENYIEYPEIILFYILCYKLVEMNIKSTYNSYHRAPQ
jgi:hypothetical protein